LWKFLLPLPTIFLWESWTFTCQIIPRWLLLSRA
jgi:hypothetical protein